MHFNRILSVYLYHYQDATTTLFSFSENQLSFLLKNGCDSPAFLRCCHLTRGHLCQYDFTSIYWPLLSDKAGVNSLHEEFIATMD